MIKKILIATFVVFWVLTLDAQTIMKHGLIAGGSFGGGIKSDVKAIPEVNYTDVSFKSNYTIGYRFRLDPGVYSTFVDLDANVGMKNWESSYIISFLEPPRYHASSSRYYVSVAGTFNYLIYQRFSVGLGLEPTYSFWQDGEESSIKFDAPLLGKVAYDFGVLEVAFGYRHGLTNTLKTDRIKSGKFRELFLSVFIPF